MNGLGWLWRFFRPALWWCALLLLAGCGGGGGGSSPATPAPVLDANVQALVVDAGPVGMTSAAVNVPYTSVRICQPGTTVCQTIDHVLVDTGSTGLRLLSSAVASLTLPGNNVGGLPLYNCVQFIDQSYMWGAVVNADLYLGGNNLDGEKAANLPVQLVGAAGAPTVPTACAPTGFTAKNTVNKLGANGILGVGYYPQDCANPCTSNARNGYYYVNSGTNVTGTTVSLSQQLQQPVSLFANHNNGTSDNNGVAISLPSIPSSGARDVTGTLKFGIGTQANNQPGLVSVMTLNASGYFTTAFNTSTLTKGFVDSGSNGWFFGTSTYPPCSGAVGWYCPPGPQALSATNTGANNQPSTVNFSIANASSLLGNASVTALSTLAGPIGDSLSFDFGLPFFYGRTVFTAIQGRSTPLGVGPYVAY
jgi:Protein of unknown function (DUF3443)